MKTWQLQEAKARFSRLVKEADTQGPQEVTVRGESAVVVLSRREYDRLAEPRPGFVAFMRSSPLMGVEFDLARDRDLTRDVDL